MTGLEILIAAAWALSAALALTLIVAGCVELARKRVDPTIVF